MAATSCPTSDKVSALVSPLSEFAILALVRLRHGKPAEARADILAVLRAEPSRRNLQMFERGIRRVGNPDELADVYQMIQSALGQGPLPGRDEGTGMQN